jgi:hypothetical protein
MRWIPVVIVVILACCGSARGERVREWLEGAEVDLRLEGGLLYEWEWRDPQVTLPAWLDERALPREFGEWRGDDRPISDNPLPHGSWWNDLALDVRKDDVGASLDLIMEHRGESNGVHSTDVAVVFPKLLVWADETFPLGGETFRSGLS